MSSHHLSPSEAHQHHSRARRGRQNVTRACLQCRRSHLACDFGRPCKRCAQKGIECVEDTSVRKRGPKTGVMQHRSGIRRCASAGSFSPHSTPCSSPTAHMSEDAEEEDDDEEYLPHHHHHEVSYFGQGSRLRICRDAIKTPNSSRAVSPSAAQPPKQKRRVVLSEKRRQMESSLARELVVLAAPTHHMTRIMSMESLVEDSASGSDAGSMDGGARCAPFSPSSLDLLVRAAASACSSPVPSCSEHKQQPVMMVSVTSSSSSRRRQHHPRTMMSATMQFPLDVLVAAMSQSMYLPLPANELCSLPRQPHQPVFEMPLSPCASPSSSASASASSSPRRSIYEAETVDFA